MAVAAVSMAAEASAGIALSAEEETSDAASIAAAALHALQATTVRPSERSVEEAGDNPVFFGADGQPVSGLWVGEAYVFPVNGLPVVYPVQFV